MSNLFKKNRKKNPVLATIFLLWFALCIIFIIVNAISVGNKDAAQTIDLQLDPILKDHEGFFVNRVYSNKWNTLDFDEVELLRQGGHYSNEIELIPIAEVESKCPNIHLNLDYSLEV